METLPASGAPAARCAVALFSTGRGTTGGLPGAPGGRCHLFGGGIGQHAAAVREGVVAGRRNRASRWMPDATGPPPLPAALHRTGGRCQLWALAGEGAELVANAAPPALP